MRNVRMTIWVVVIILSVANIAPADVFDVGGANEFTIDFVNIPGDTNPASGYGIVNNDYRMGTYEITNDQWDKFKANYGTVTGSPSNAYDWSPYWTGTDVPTTNVSWYEAAQFVNYLNTSTGHQAAYKFTGTQGTGDYTLGVWESGPGYDSTNPYRNSNAFYFLPTEDEWVKAAYWNGTSLQTYANASPGDLISGSPDPAKWNYDPSAGNEPWNVGSGSEELNGTFDMMGNLWEWMESPYSSGDYLSGSSRGIRGGCYANSDGGLRSPPRHYDNPSYGYATAGFRVASVPEPSAPPVADANGPYTLYAGDTLTLDASGSIDDANDIISYVWDLDDDGVFETDAGTEAVFDVSYAYLESLGIGIDVDYNIHLKVTDGDDQADTDTTTLTIDSTLVIAVDIKPTSCPNPVNTKSKGVLPVAILGSDTFDVMDIDPDTILLEGIPPLRASYADVAAPVDGTDCACTTDGPDGFMDLTLKFDKQQVVAVLGEVEDGQEWQLYLIGTLNDGTPIEGSDCIVILKKGKANNPVPVDMDGDGYDDSVDCDDTDPDINPGAEEVFDGVDNNCDGLIDEGTIIEIDSCQTLDQPNTYYRLTGDITTTGSCFIIEADGITLDLNGYTITGDGDYTVESIGIYSYGNSYITIKNGRVADFYHGTWVEGGSGNVEENMIYG